MQDTPAMPSSLSDLASAPRCSRVVVVGGGWAGWGAAKALCEAGFAVTLLDGMADPTGVTPFTTASGKPFEAGTRGFWRDYPNINALTDALDLGPDPLGDFARARDAALTLDLDPLENVAAALFEQCGGRRGSPARALGFEIATKIEELGELIGKLRGCGE